MATTAETAGQTHKGRMLGYFTLLAMASLIWSAQGTAVKFLDRQMGPIAITFVPFYITTHPVGAAAHSQAASESQSLSGPPGPIGASSRSPALVGQVLAQLGMTWGIYKSLASNGAVLNLMIPVITAVLASFMLHEKLSRLRIASLGIGLVGVLLMSVQDLRESSFLEMKYIAGNGSHSGRLLRLFVLQHVLQRPDAALSGNRDPDLQLHHRFAGQRAPADLGGTVPLERIRRVSTGKPGPRSHFWRSSCTARRCCFSSPHSNTWT